MKIFVYLIISAGLVLVTACGSANAMPVDSKSDNTTPLSTPVPAEATDVPVTPPAADMPSSAAQKMVELSREHLSQLLKIELGKIVTTKVEPAIWPDASLGCPKTGMAYIQVLTPGFLVRLEVNGQQYLYHTDESETVILCTGEAMPEFPVTPGDIQDGIPWVPAN